MTWSNTNDLQGKNFVAKAEQKEKERTRERKKEIKKERKKERKKEEEAVRSHARGQKC